MARPRSTGPLHAPKLRAATFPGSEPAPRCMGAPKLHGLAPPLDMEQGSRSKALGLASKSYLADWQVTHRGFPSSTAATFQKLSWGLVSCKRQRSTKSNDSWCLRSSFYILFIYLYTCHCFTIVSLFMRMRPHPNGDLSSELQFSLQFPNVQPQLAAQGTAAARGR